MNEFEYAVLAFLAFFGLAGAAVQLLLAVKHRNMMASDVAMFVINLTVYSVVTWQWYATCIR